MTKYHPKIKKRIFNICSNDGSEQYERGLLVILEIFNEYLSIETVFLYLQV
jgi:hypothetical protein